MCFQRFIVHSFSVTRLAQQNILLFGLWLLRQIALGLTLLRMATHLFGPAIQIILLIKYFI